MRILIFLLLFFPFFGNAQKTEIFIRLTDSKGQQIKGEAVSKGFENWLGTTSLTAGGKNNTQLSFTMTVNGASADLKRALANREFLLNGQVSAMVSDPSRGVPMKSYTIKMEKIAVLTCYE